MFSANFAKAQLVGLVLSGGGATGIAHVGVLMALEEAGIPIDYITGTSAGALVGAMYTAGYSPQQIRDYVLQESFYQMATGVLPPEKKFLLRDNEESAEMLSLPFKVSGGITRSLPTNLVTPILLDYEMLKVFGLTGVMNNKDFNQLFVPFRCVAADIENKKPVVFSRGDLNAAVRASMTYPFYVNPIAIDGKLLFDGGMYNNFPADVMYDNFNADFIIGSNVSGNAAPPNEDDLISQLQNMLVVPSNFSLPCDEGIMINQSVPVGTFDFNKAEEAIRIGYETTKLYIDSIRTYVTRQVDGQELYEKRKEFHSRSFPIQISEIVAVDQGDLPLKFVERSILKDSSELAIDWKLFEERYFKVYATPQIKYMYPTISLKKDSTAIINLKVSKQKPFVFRAGGHFSSRPVNTGYIGVSYLDLSDAAFALTAESYFGKFYGSARVKADFDVPSTFPVRITPYFTMNRWDYFRSFATFFEDVKPSFLVQNEMYYGVRFSFPIKNSIRTDIDFRAFSLEDSYYQTQNFTNADTADFTLFDGQTAIWRMEHNTLNRKQWASSGRMVKIQARYVQGREQSVAGTTAPIFYDIRKQHRWISVSAEGQYFPLSKGVFRLGIHGKGVLNSQSLFANYTATVLSTTEFAPLPDVQTFFLEEYRAPQYVGIGLNLIFSINNLLDFRLDPYLFQPFRQITRFENGTFGYDDLFAQGTYLAGASLVYHSPLGPVRFTTNYFPKQNKPLFAQLSFGYVIFNKRAIR
jgi:NTE family protein